MPRWKSRAIAGNATMVTDPSTNTAPEPRIVPASIHCGDRAEVGTRGFYTRGSAGPLRYAIIGRFRDSHRRAPAARRLRLRAARIRAARPTAASADGALRG